MATYSNLYIDQGSDFNATIDLSQTTGSLDLTGYTAEGKIAKSYDGTIKGIFAVVVDSTNGELDLSLPAAQTAALKPGRYVYDVIIKSDTDIVTRVLEGQLNVTPGVTFVEEAEEIPPANKSIFKKTGVHPSFDAYALIELDQSLYYDNTVNSSITLNVHLLETQNANIGVVKMFLTTESFTTGAVVGAHNIEDNFSVTTDGSHSAQTLVNGNNTITLEINSSSATEDPVRYLAIVYDQTTTGGEIEFELKDLEITSSTHPEGFTVGFKSPANAVNANTLNSSTTKNFGSISSPTALFKT